MFRSFIVMAILAVFVLPSGDAFAEIAEEKTVCGGEVIAVMVEIPQGEIQYVLDDKGRTVIVVSTHHIGPKHQSVAQAELKLRRGVTASLSDQGIVFTEGGKTSTALHGVRAFPQVLDYVRTGLELVEGDGKVGFVVSGINWIFVLGHRQKTKPSGSSLFDDPVTTFPVIQRRVLGRTHRPVNRVGTGDGYQWYRSPLMKGLDKRATLAAINPCVKQYFSKRTANDAVSQSPARR